MRISRSMRLSVMSELPLKSNPLVVFHRVCPAEHGNLYGERPYFRTDGPATSIGTDLPGGGRHFSFPLSISLGDFPVIFLKLR